MKIILFVIILLIAIALPAFGNPVPVLPDMPAETLLVPALIILFSLLAESVVIVLLSKRKHLVRDTFLWLLVTLGTFCLLVVVPLGFFDWELFDFAGMHDRKVIYLEVIIIFIEGLILWLLWLRRSGVHIAYSFLISCAGNILSYAIALVCFTIIP